MEDDYLRPLPRYLEPHYKRLDDIGTSIFCVMVSVIAIGSIYFLI